MSERFGKSVKLFFYFFSMYLDDGNPACRQGETTFGGPTVRALKQNVVNSTLLTREVFYTQNRSNNSIRFPNDFLFFMDAVYNIVKALR